MSGKIIYFVLKNFQIFIKYIIPYAVLVAPQKRKVKKNMTLPSN